MAKKTDTNEITRREIEKTIEDYWQRKNEGKVEEAKKEKYERIKPDLSKPLNQNEKALLYAIIEQCCLDYREAYEKGDKKEYIECRLFLQSDKTARWTEGDFDGIAILETIDKELEGRFGSFEKVYQRKIAGIDKLIKELSAEMKNIKEKMATADDNEKRYLRKKRLQIYGRIKRLEDKKNQ